MKRLRNLRIGKFAIFGVGVLSDLLAELGAGIARIAIIVAARVGLLTASVVSGIVVEKYKIALVATVAFLLAAMYLHVRRGKRQPTVAIPKEIAREDEYE